MWVSVYMAVRNPNSQLSQVIPVGQFVHTKLLLIMYRMEKVYAHGLHVCYTLVTLIVLLCN